MSDKPDMDQLYCDAVNALKRMHDALLDSATLEGYADKRKAIVRLAKQVAEFRENLREGYEVYKYVRQTK